MTRDEALRLALEALELVSIEFVCNGAHHAKKDRHEWLDPCPIVDRYKKAITAIKAALEAKDEKANDELRRLHDLLGKANALARIRANKIDELEQRLTKTEAQLGEAVWNYGELKREQLANQQKTSGSPINTSTALEAKDEPVANYGYCPVCGAKGTSRERHPDGNTTCVNGHKYKSRDTLSAPPQQEAKDEPHKWKLVPIEPTNEMLKAMDECSMEGYDERLYAGHAASVYMAAVDVAPNPPEARNQEPVACVEYIPCCTDKTCSKCKAAIKPELVCVCGAVWEGQELIYTPPQRKEPEPVVWMYQDKSTHEVRFQKHMRGFVDHGATYETPLYTTPPQRKPLTDDEITLIIADCASSHQHTDIHLARAIEQAHGIKGEA